MAITNTGEVAMEITRPKIKKRVEAFKPWVARVHKMLREKFFVREYECSLHLAKEDKESRSHAGNNVGSEIDISISYLSYDLTVYPVLKRHYNNGRYCEVVKTLVHEMCHLYTEPLYCFAVDAASNINAKILEQIREQQTQRIASCIYELLPEKEWKPKISLK